MTSDFSKVCTGRGLCLRILISERMKFNHYAGILSTLFFMHPRTTGNRLPGGLRVPSTHTNSNGIRPLKPKFSKTFHTGVSEAELALGYRWKLQYLLKLESKITRWQGKNQPRKASSKAWFYLFLDQITTMKMRFRFCLLFISLLFCHIWSLRAMANIGGPQRGLAWSIFKKLMAGCLLPHVTLWVILDDDGKSWRLLKWCSPSTFISTFTCT